MILATSDAQEALETEGLDLAQQLVRIAADEAERDAPAEAAELRRIEKRLGYHLQRVKHVHYRSGNPEVWSGE